MREWEAGAVRPLAIAQLGERYRRYRLADPATEEAMVRSLRQYGQLAPAVACLREGRPELLDGFKRRAAAALLPWPTLSVRVVEADEAQAKAAVYGLNRTGSRPQQLEEAWIVHALVREDGLTQVQAAELLGQHKSWVCRRLALLERLGDEAKAELRLGLLAPSLARQLTRLPVGNQAAVLTTVRREALTTQEARGVIDLLAGASPEQEHFILTQPREALLQAEGVPGLIRDLRLSPGGNRVARQLRYLLDALGGMASWLHYPGLAELKRSDRLLLQPRFERLAQDTRLVATLVDDLLRELQLTPSGGRRAMDEKLRNEIVQRWQAQTPQRRIARELGVARTTVQHVIDRFERQRSGQAPASPLPRPSQRPSTLTEHDAFIGQLLERYPNMTAVRVHEELRARGFGGSYTIVRERVSQLRPQPARQPVVRFETAPGAQAQMDYSTYDIDFGDEGRRRVYLFSYVLSYSRRAYMRFVKSC